ncbi:MAG: type II toxin-antitoxin system HicA family toxin, partial [Methanotrichaceae archaeon]
MFRLSKLRPVEADKAVRALVKIGFRAIRQRGSHLVMKHSDGRVTVIPIHKEEVLGRGIL